MRHFEPFIESIINFEHEIEEGVAIKFEIQVLDDSALFLDVVVFIACVLEAEFEIGSSKLLCGDFVLRCAVGGNQKQE